MYSILDVNTLDVPDTSPETFATRNFYRIHDHYFLVLSHDSVMELSGIPRELVSLLNMEDEPVSAVFQADEQGIPVGYDHATKNASPGIFSLATMDQEIIKTNLVDYMNGRLF